jgi:hypothetical protein
MTTTASSPALDEDLERCILDDTVRLRRELDALRGDLSARGLFHRGEYGSNSASRRSGLAGVPARFAGTLAQAKGLDPDQPRGLTSVTLAS